MKDFSIGLTEIGRLTLNVNGTIPYKPNLSAEHLSLTISLHVNYWEAGGLDAKLCLQPRLNKKEKAN